MQADLPLLILPDGPQVEPRLNVDR